MLARHPRGLSIAFGCSRTQYNYTPPSSPRTCIGTLAIPQADLRTLEELAVCVASIQLTGSAKLFRMNQFVAGLPSGCLEFPAMLTYSLVLAAQ